MKLPLITALIFTALNSRPSLAEYSLDSMQGDVTSAPIREKERPAPIPGDQSIPDLSSSLDEQLKKMQKIYEITRKNQPPQDLIVLVDEEKKGAENKDGTGNSQSKPSGPKLAYSEPAPTNEKKSEPEPEVSRPKTRPSVRRVARTPRQRAPKTRPDVFIPSEGVTIFYSNLDEVLEEMIRIPGYSTALATIRGGDQVTQSTKSWVVAELEYAFLGPNGHIVNLKGCRAGINLHPNFHIERVRGNLDKIICVSEKGKDYQVYVEGKILDVKNEYGGIESPVIMAGKGKAMVLQALQSMVSTVGQAMSFAELENTSSSSQYSTSEVSNVRGNKGRYITGKTLESFDNFFSYIIDFYKNMEPGMAVKSGAKILIQLKSTVEIPAAFFKESFHLSEVHKEITTWEN